MLVNLAEYQIADWRFRDRNNLVLRVIPNETFVAEDNADGDLIEAEKFYGEVCVRVVDETFAGYTTPVLIIPPLVIQSTTDARFNRGATYRAEIWNVAKRHKVFSFQSLVQFKVPPIDHTITWSDIIQFNSPLNVSPIQTLDDEIKMLIFSQISELTPVFSSGTPGRLTRFKATGLGQEDSSFQASGTSLEPISPGFDLGSPSAPFNNGWINNLNVNQVISGAGAFAGSVSLGGDLEVTGDLKIDGISEFTGLGTFDNGLNVNGTLAGFDGDFAGTLTSQDATIQNLVVANQIDTPLVRAGVAGVPSGFGVQGVSARRLAVWQDSATDPIFIVRSDASQPFVGVTDTRNNEDALVVQRDPGMLLNDGHFLVKAIGGGTLGYSGIGVSSQFERVKASTRGIPVQTLDRALTLVSAAGGTAETPIASYTIPLTHPTLHEGENYSFRVVGDLTGTTSTHIIRVYVNNVVIVSHTIAPASNLTWEATGSITMINFGSGTVVYEAKLLLSDGSVEIGATDATGVTALDGVTLKVTAEDSGAGETRSVFSEFFHNDWKALP